MRNSGILFLGLLFLGLSAAAQQPNLSYYLTQALSNSPLLKDYQDQQQSNQVDSLRIIASYKPQVTANSLNSFAPSYKGFGYDYAVTNGGTLSALLGVNKTVISKAYLGTQFQTIQLQNQLLANHAKISEQDLKRNVTAQYITAYGDLQQLNFNREESALLEKEEQLLKILTEKNVYRQTDYLIFYVTLQQQKITGKQLEIQYANDLASLNYLCGITDTTTLPIADPDIVLDPLPDISNSVFFQQFVLDSLQLSNSRAMVDFSYRPKINVFGDGGFYSAFSYQGYKNFGASIGLSITLPVYDGHQKQLQYNKISIAEHTRQVYQDFFKRQYRQQVAQLMQQLYGTDQLIGEIRDQIRYSKALIEVNEKLLGTGDAKITDYVLAINNYLTAKNLLTQNNINHLQIINQINYWNR